MPVSRVIGTPFFPHLRSAFFSHSTQALTRTVGVAATRGPTFSAGISRPFSTIPKMFLDATAYIAFQKSTNSEKERKVFEHALDKLLAKFDVHAPVLTSKEKWEQLQSNLESYYSYRLAPYNAKNPLENTQNLFSIFYPFLIRKGQLVRRFGLQDYISTVSEFQWALSQVSYPFTRLEATLPQDYSSIQDLLDQCPDPHVIPQEGERLSPTSEAARKYALLSGERDASAAMLLATHHINEGTFVHEIGCWNGQNLINLLFYTSLQGRVPKYCVGTNINSLALSMAKSTASLFKIDGSFLNFCLANALEPFDPSFLNLEFHNEVKLALRVIPVLEPSYAVKLLESVRASIRCKEAVLVVSYAVPKGEMYEKNLSRSQDLSQTKFAKKSFFGGETFYASFSDSSLLPKYLQVHDKPRVVLNTYYSE